MSRRDRRSRPTRATAAVAGPGAGPLARAAAVLAQGQHAEAEQICRRVVTADRTSADAHRLLARALREQGRFDEAMLAARRATTFAPRSAPAHTELGAVLAAQDRAMEALRSFERAIELDPRHADAYNRYGTALLDLGELERALVSFGRVAELLPRDPAHHANVAMTLSLMGRYEAARAASDRALALGPNEARLRYNRSFARLATGDLPGGWEDQEFGFAVGERTPDRSPPVPRWGGTDLSAKRLLVWREQGLGDEVRFASCYPEVIDHADHVVLECEPRLVALFARSFPDASVRAQSLDPTSGRETSSFDGIDLHCPAGSLPRFLRRRLEDFPDHDGYLTADPELRSHWRDRLDSLGDGLKVGIAWRSMNLATSRLRHYLTLDELDPVVRLAGIDLVNLQYGPVEQLETELDALEERSGVFVHRWDDIDYTRDIEAVAALTAELDVVVGPGSFPTVLAGALGVPTLVLAPASPWTLGQDHDPWFPATRHFVRDWNEPWSRTAAAAAGHLRQLVSGTLPEDAS